MLHQIRGSLGRDCLVARGQNEIGLSNDAIWCDAVAFQNAIHEERLIDALELYRGELLEGFFVSNASPEFEQWLDNERFRLRNHAADAARKLIQQAERDGDTAGAIRWARKASVLDPYDETGIRRLIALLDEAGDRSGALRIYEHFAALLEREFDAEPSAETRALIEKVRERKEPRDLTAPGDDAPRELPIRSIAVLPFENTSSSADAEPFAMGLHDDLLTELSRISSLTVIARASMQRYRGTTKGISEIARELGVGTVIEGAVQSSGGRLRLNVQVIDARNGTHRWAERYDRDLTMDNIFDLQGEIAEKIARATQAELTPSERERSGSEPTENLEAYRHYARGRGLLDQRTEGAMRRSLYYYERATELDPTYALAWVGFADALILLYDYGYETAERVLPRAEKAIDRALELNATLPEAHTSLGLLNANRRRGFVGLSEFRKAVQLRPGQADAHNWISWNSLVLGYPQDALESATRAVELDPMFPEAVSNLSLSYLVNGDAEEALRLARRTRDLQPDWTTGNLYEGLALYHLGRFGEAIAVLRNLTAKWAGSGPNLTLALACAAAGESAEADGLLTEFQEKEDAFAEGILQLAVGIRKRAFEILKDVDRWDYWTCLAMHHFYPDVMAPLRASQLYDGMCQKMNRCWGREIGSERKPGHARMTVK
ncbi:MAG TPA: BTAD domain-containing putative transcriptional regulator [Longimicrobiaceae bacterium]|nr:BTAD domain-containing putative transcriptional regulator [Longimicrobiaceae bacterium]